MSNVRCTCNTYASLYTFQKCYINADIAHNTVETMSANKRINKVLETSFVELHGICYESQAFFICYYVLACVHCITPRHSFRNGRR